MLSITALQAEPLTAHEIVISCKNEGEGARWAMRLRQGGLPYDLALETMNATVRDVSGMLFVRVTLSEAYEYEIQKGQGNKEFIALNFSYLMTGKCLINAELKK
jgi:hypothetical protein